jgi:hypothetical protein
MLSPETHPQSRSTRPALRRRRARRRRPPPARAQADAGVGRQRCCWRPKNRGSSISPTTEPRMLRWTEPASSMVDPAFTFLGLRADHPGAVVPVARDVTKLPAGIRQTTVEFKLSFTRPMSSETGEVRGEGRVSHCGRSIAIAEGASAWTRWQAHCARNHDLHDFSASVTPTLSGPIFRHSSR